MMLKLLIALFAANIFAESSFLNPAAVSAILKRSEGVLATLSDASQKLAKYV